MQSSASAETIDFNNQLELLPEWVQAVMSLYGDFDGAKAMLLKDLYTDDVVFTDPIHSLQGIDPLEKYFNHISKGLVSCQFKFYDTCVVDHCAWLKWTMTFSHSKLASGREIEVHGATELKRSDKIFSHTDFYDMGAMVYENVPVLSKVTRWLKQRLASR